MANNTSKQILEEGPRNMIVKLAGILDSSDVSMVPAVSFTDCLNNDPGFGTLVGFRVLGVDYSSGPNLVTSLEWGGGSPQLIVAFAQSEEADYRKIGGISPNRQVSGYNGSINLRTRGYIAGAVEAFTFVVKLAKLYSQTGV